MLTIDPPFVITPECAKAAAQYAERVQAVASWHPPKAIDEEPAKKVLRNLSVDSTDSEAQ
jgi:hypothetical protein